MLVFLVAGRRHALPVGDVERVVPAAEVTPLPDAPPDVRGAVKVGSEVAPRVGLPGIAFACAFGWCVMLAFEVPYYFWTCREL